MKTSILLILAVLGSVANAARLECSAARWNCSPIAWTFNPASETLRSRGPGSFAVYDAPRCSEVRISAKVTPIRSGNREWSVVGVAMVDDARNYWHVALVQSPPEKGASHFFELAESRDGNWIANAADRLVSTHHRQSGNWRFGETYEIALECTQAGISGCVKNAKGETIWESGFAFPKPDANGSVKAVTCGRPAVHANGGFVAVCSALEASWSKEKAKEEAVAKIPPYESESFVPGIADRATGFFRVVQKDGRWWVIDPLGRGMVLLGVDHVTYRGHYSERTKRRHYLETNEKRFPNQADWEKDTIGRLKSWGFNLLGAGCEENLKHRGLIHTVFLSIGDGLCWDGVDSEYCICPNEHRPCSAFPNVFHPDFPAWADYQARRRCAPNRADPWLFGYFIDNELAWWGRGAADTGLFEAVEKLPESHSAKQALKKFLAEKGVKGAASVEVKREFLRRAAELYFGISSAAIRRHDPNHLIMGARFAGLGGAHPIVWEVSGKYCDVVTFNCYPWADLDRNVVFTDRGGNARRITQAFASQYELVKRPMLITEWSFPALDSGLPCTGGAGQRFKTQSLRTQATELFARTMLALPFLIGYDYFMWVDEPPEGISDAFPEDSNYGLINERGEAYPEITAMFTRLQRNIGAVRSEGVPAERAAPAASGETSAEFLSRFGAWGEAKYVRDGRRYVIRNAAGLELSGEIGGSRMFDWVKVNGVELGSYTGMWNDIQAGVQRWHDAGKVVAADWRVQDGRGTLYVTCEGWSGRDRGMAETHAIAVFADKPWFLCNLVSAKNIGRETIEINAFYFRQYSPFAADKLKLKRKWKKVPNLWKDVMHDVWISADSGAYYGGISFAPMASHFLYHLMDKGRSQHPDAMFSPGEPLVMRAGEVYDPKGRMWMLAIGGIGGVDGWQDVVKKF